MEKGDTSLVTEADRRAERLLRDFVAKNFPEHGVIGEEYYDEQKASEFQWIIDPIDGTQNFFHGIPTYGTILGIHRDNQPIVAIIDHPALGIRLRATRDAGTFWNDRRILLNDSPDDPLGKNDIIGLSTREMFKRSGDEKLFDTLTALHGSHRVYFDIYASSLTMGGHMSAMVEYNVMTWDLAATELLVSEAGGLFKLVKSTPRLGLPPRLSAVFGRPATVERICEFIGGYE